MSIVRPLTFALIALLAGCKPAPSASYRLARPAQTNTMGHTDHAGHGHDDHGHAHPHRDPASHPHRHVAEPEYRCVTDQNDAVQLAQSLVSEISGSCIAEADVYGDGVTSSLVVVALLNDVPVEFSVPVSDGSRGLSLNLRPGMEPAYWLPVLALLRSQPQLTRLTLLPFIDRSTRLLHAKIAGQDTLCRLTSSWDGSSDFANSQASCFTIAGSVDKAWPLMTADKTSVGVARGGQTEVWKFASGGLLIAGQLRSERSPQSQLPGSGWPPFWTNAGRGTTQLTGKLEATEPEVSSRSGNVSATPSTPAWLAPLQNHASLRIDTPSYGLSVPHIIAARVKQRRGEDKTTGSLASFNGDGHWHGVLTTGDIVRIEDASRLTGERLSIAVTSEMGSTSDGAGSRRLRWEAFSPVGHTLRPIGFHALGAFTYWTEGRTGREEVLLYEVQQVRQGCVELSRVEAHNDSIVRERRSSEAFVPPRDRSGQWSVNEAEGFTQDCN